MIVSDPYIRGATLLDCNVGLPNGAPVRTSLASIATIQDGIGVYVATVGGTADAITLTASPAITAYVAGQAFRFIASGANTTAVTVAINGLAAKAITKNGTTALIAGDIPSGTMVQIAYDGTRYILGTIGRDVSVMTPADNIFRVVGSADATKKLAFEVDGLTTATTRTLTTQDQDGTIALTLQNSPSTPIINGSMDIWQRGTSFVAVAGNTYTADRWARSSVGAGVATVSQSTNVPTVAQAGVLFNYSLDVDVTTADASLVATDLYGMYHFIEGYNWRQFAQRDLTISFWVRDTITGEHCVAVGNPIDRSYIANYTINVADTWEYKTVTIPASPSAGTWNYTNAHGLLLLFVMAVGSNFHTTAGAWQTGGPFYGTSTTVNSMSNAANFFRFTGVKLELGSVATPLQFRSFQEELALCQRYYAKTYDLAVVPGTATSGGALNMNATGTGANAASLQWNYPVRMRTAPTIVTYSTVTGTAGQLRRSTAGADVASTTGTVGEFGVVIFNNGAVTDSEVIAGQATAAAEL